MDSKTLRNSRKRSTSGPLRLSAIALALSSISMLAAPELHAEDGQSIAEIQAEIARLQKVLEQKKQAQSETTQASPALDAKDLSPGAEQQAQHERKAPGGKEPSLLEAIVVRAQKRNDLEKLLEVPKSISVVSGEELQQFAATNISEVLTRIGNVKFNYGNPRTGSLSLRGISTSLVGGGSDSVDPSVGVIVDGISYANNQLSTGADYIDIESVNVTRGPQGSDGGKSTSIGRIGIITRHPSFDPEASASLTLGQNNTVKAQAVIGGTVIEDKLAWRGTFFRSKQDGAYENQYALTTGRSSYVNSDRTYGKVQFLLTPTRDLNARFTFDVAPRGSEYLNGLSYKKAVPSTYANGASTANVLTLNPNKILARDWFSRESKYSYADYINTPLLMDNDGAIITGFTGSSAELNWKLPRHTLTSISAYRSSYFSAANDEGTSFDVTQNGGYIITFKQLSQELRLSSETGGFTDYQTGLYFIKTEGNSRQRTRYGSDGGAWYASAAQYATLGADSAGRLLLSDSLNRFYKSTNVLSDSKSSAAFGQINWHFSEPLTATTGVRFTHENRRTQASQLVSDDGYGRALNPVSVNNLQLGGFSSSSTGSLGKNNTATQLSLADKLAKQYFGAAVTATPGEAYNSLSAAQKLQVAAAKALRNSQLGTLYDLSTAEPYEGDLISGNVSLNYKFNENVNTYVSWQHGVKAGVSQIAGATAAGGTSALVKPETSDVYELGIKTNFWNNKFTLSADIFQDNIRDFQQTVYFYDETASAANGTSTYTSGNGNVPKVRIRGLELDAVFTGIPNTSLRFAGAYNDSKYVDFKFAGQPAENGNLAEKYRDISGRTLPQAPKLTFDLVGDYRRPVFDNKIFHASANYKYTTRYNTDTTLSDYAWVEGYGLTDLSFGIGRRDGLFDVNVIVKNLFNTEYEGTKTWVSWTPSTPRWVGVTFSGKL